MAAPRFTYKIAAAYSAKGARFDRKKNYFTFDSSDASLSSSGQPTTPEKALDAKYASGQDAFFVAPVANAPGAAAFGVADGVGGYMDQGIDSADFAHGLCNYMASSAATFPKHFEKKNSTTLEPLPLLRTAYEQVCHDEKIKGGGSTACLAVADTEGCLKVANLGDSGFIQLRLNAVHYYSYPQTHAFNTPFQLSRVPPKILTQMKNFGGKPFCDMPEVASLTQHELRHGDILVFGTDGIWDNLTPQEILNRAAHDLISNGAWTMPPNDGVQVSSALSWLTSGGIAVPGSDDAQNMSIQTLLALNLADLAKRASHDRKRMSPFGREVQRTFGERWDEGGKVDDQVCMCIIAIDTEAAAPKAKI